MVTRKTRNLIVTGLYAGCLLSTLAGTAVQAATGVLYGWDLGLTVAGVALWMGATCYNVYRRIAEKKLEIAENNGEDITAQQEKLLPRSTYAKISPSLSIPAALLFYGVDAYKLGQPTLTLITRSAGSLVWCNNSIQGLIVACLLDQRRQHPTSKKGIVCNMRETSVSVILDMENLLAASLYAIAIYGDTSLNPYKVTTNAFWMLAGLFDLVQDSYARHVVARANVSVDTTVEAMTDVPDLAETVIAMPSSPLPTLFAQRVPSLMSGEGKDADEIISSDTLEEASKRASISVGSLSKF